MLSSVLRSKQTVAVNVEIMRAFVELRQMAHSHREPARRVDLGARGRRCDISPSPAPGV